MLFSNDVRAVGNESRAILQNAEVLAVSQDPAMRAGTLINNDVSAGSQVWARPLHDGSMAVALLNTGLKRRRKGN